MQRIKAALLGLVFIAYPAIIYYFLSNGLPWIGATLVAGLLGWKIHQRGPQAGWFIFIVVLAIASGAYFGPTFIAKMAPLLIHVSLLYIFGSSLKSTPLIERFARLDFPELPPEIEIYCRRLTMVWVGFFALNIAICITLAISSHDKLWIMYNGLIVYLLIGALVIGEYFWRKFRFPDLEIPTMQQTIQNISRNGHHIWGSKDEPVSPAE